MSLNWSRIGAVCLGLFIGYLLASFNHDWGFHVRHAHDWIDDKRIIQTKRTSIDWTFKPTARLTFDIFDGPMMVAKGKE